MNESSLKRISGEDKLTGRYLFSNQVEFYPYIKLTMGTNYIPPLGADEAMKRRIRYIYFDKKFTHNPNPNNPNELKINTEFTEKLKTEYLSEIFSWIAKGAYNLYKCREIIMPQSYQERTNKLLTEGDSIECFIKRKIIKTTKYEDIVKKNDLFEEYKHFCTENSQRCIARSTLWARMAQFGIDTRAKDGYDVFFGLEIKDDKQEEKYNPLDGEPEITYTPDYKKLYLEQQEEMNKLKEQLKELNEKLKIQEVVKKEVKEEVKEEDKEEVKEEEQSKVKKTKSKKEKTDKPPKKEKDKEKLTIDDLFNFT
jgi:phage/plasmid-associated DNA primase